MNLMPQNRLSDNFRANVRRCRVALGLTQAELASRAGVSPPYISILESGNEHDFRLCTLERFAEALAVSPLALLSDPAKEKSKKAG